jgi:hypothetical protein
MIPKDNVQKQEFKMNVGKRLFLLTATLLALLNSPSPARAIDDDSSCITLSGIKGFHVFVEKLAPSIRESGLTSNDLLEVARRKLAIAGVPVINEAKSVEELRKEGVPYLFVVPIIMKTKFGKNYFYTIIIRFYQLTSLVRDPSIRAYTCTWLEVLKGISPDLDLVKAHFASLLEMFINDYYSVNPR